MLYELTNDEVNLLNELIEDRIESNEYYLKKHLEDEYAEGVEEDIKSLKTVQLKLEA